MRLCGRRPLQHPHPDPKTVVTNCARIRFSPVDANYKNRTDLSMARQGKSSRHDGRGRPARLTQKFRVVKVSGGRATVLGQGLRVPPPNVGNNVTPAYNDADGMAVSGATTLGDLDVYTRSTIYSLRSGEVVWAGPRDDSFFSDIPGVFDLSMSDSDNTAACRTVWARTAMVSTASRASTCCPS